MKQWTNLMKIIAKWCKHVNFIKREKFTITKNTFFCLLNLNSGHPQSSADMAIGKTSIRALQKPSYCHQQMIVRGPNSNLLTNGKNLSLFFSFIPFLQKYHHSATILIDFPIILTKITFFVFFYWFKSIIGIFLYILIWLLLAWWSGENGSPLRWIRQCG